MNKGSQIRNQASIRNQKLKKIDSAEKSCWKRNKKPETTDKWSKEEVELLLKLKNEENMKFAKMEKFFKSYPEPKKAAQIRSKWQRIKPGMKTGSWLKDEEKRLIELVEIHGTNKWSLISKILGGRTSKAAREKYENQLSPNINKNPLTEEECKKLLDLVKKFDTKWTKLAKDHFINRSDSILKNYYYSYLNKLKKNKGINCNKKTKKYAKKEIYQKKNCILEVKIKKSPKVLLSTTCKSQELSQENEDRDISREQQESDECINIFLKLL